MSRESGLFDRPLSATLDGWLLDRSGQPALAREGVRPSLRWLHSPSGPLAPGDAARDVKTLARALATVAWTDMSLAFSLWCHRMVLEYLLAGKRTPTVRQWLASLEAAEMAGSTALAAAMAHHVSGAPLSITGHPSAEGLALEGKIRWSSNLFGSDFLLVTAVEIPSRELRIVAVRGDQVGVDVDPYPELLDLQGTFSSSLRLTGVPIDDSAILSSDFHGFIRTVRPTFLLWQASFAWGLGARALDEAALHVGRGTNRVFAGELKILEDERDRIEAAIAGELNQIGARAARSGTSSLTGSSVTAAGSGATPGELAPVVAIRLDAARLAGAATRLECKVVGGAGYARGSATARRLREAAFLPVQSPTEGQLQWELSRSL
jgi:alkylation response protein AidB-like acyl-CoA dehydrogenase